MAESVEIVKNLNPNAELVTTDWESISGSQILAAMERTDTLQAELERLAHEHEHHHHDDDDDEHCCCHDHDHEHHHHDHDHECCDHEHHHHHHHADEVFDSFGVETAKKFTQAELEIILKALNDEMTYGVIVRAKGIVEGDGGKWIHFDYVPGEPDVRDGAASVTGKICVIGAKLEKEKIRKLFNV